MNELEEESNTKKNKRKLRKIKKNEDKKQVDERLKRKLNAS